MAFVPVRIDQQVTVKLSDMVFGRRVIRPMGEDRFHNACIPRDFLLIACRERTDLAVGQESLDLQIAEPSAFDAGGGADAFDGGDAAERGEAVGGTAAVNPPRPFEFVQFRNQREDRGRYAEGFSDRPRHSSIQFDPIRVGGGHPIVHPFPSDRSWS